MAASSSRLLVPVAQGRVNMVRNSNLRVSGHRILSDFLSLLLLSGAKTALSLTKLLCFKYIIHLGSSLTRRIVRGWVCVKRFQAPSGLRSCSQLGLFVYIMRRFIMIASVCACQFNCEHSLPSPGESSIGTNKQRARTRV